MTKDCPLDLYGEFATLVKDGPPANIKAFEIWKSFVGANVRDH